MLPVYLEESIPPMLSSDPDAPLRAWKMPKTLEDRTPELTRLMKNGVLPLAAPAENPSPRRPETGPSRRLPDSVVTAPKPWCVTARPATLTASVATVPLALLPFPYSIEKGVAEL